MPMLLAKFELYVVLYFRIQGSIKRMDFPLKPDDVIVMLSNVYEWKGKPRPIA